jgi:hypothetical protein
MESLNSIIKSAINQPVASRTEKIQALNNDLCNNIRYLANLVSLSASSGDSLEESLKYSEEISSIKRALVLDILKLAKEKDISITEILKFLQAKYKDKPQDDINNNEVLFLNFLEKNIESDQPISLAKVIDAYIIQERNSKAVAILGTSLTIFSTIIGQDKIQIPTTVPEFVDISLPVVFLVTGIAGYAVSIRLKQNSNDMKKSIKETTSQFIDNKIYPSLQEEDQTNL